MFHPHLSDRAMRKDYDGRTFHNSRLEEGQLVILAMERLMVQTKSMLRYWPPYCYYTLHLMQGEI